MAKKKSNGRGATGSSQQKGGNTNDRTNNNGNGAAAQNGPARPPSSGVVHLGLPSIILTLALACSVAFLAGTAYRIHFLDLDGNNHNRSDPASAAGAAAAVGPTVDPTDSRGETIKSGGGSSSGSGSDSDAQHDGAASSSPQRSHKLMGVKPKTSGGGPDGGNKKGKSPKLPAPRLHRGKTMPETRYTGKAFPDNGRGRDAVRASHDLHIEMPPEEEADESEDVVCAEGGGDEEGECRREAAAAAAAKSAGDDEDDSSDDDDEDDEDDEHLPAGQHLLVDIKNVDASFLDSEERLAEAMVEVVSLSRLTLLSYHCHSMVPAGVSCVGVLLESHISFHTWPEEGVITLDLFTCGSGKLVPVMPTIERLFAVPQEGAGEYHPPRVRKAPGTKEKPPAGGAKSNDTKTSTKTVSLSTKYVPREQDYHELPLVVWSHVLRGFRPNIVGGWRILENDIADFCLKPLEMNSKKVITSTVTPHQQIDVVDVIDPKHQTMRGYERSVRPEVKTYESANPELFRPNRMVFLDGVIQSTRRGDEAYHEALVHPALFASDNPKKVAIIGGGEGSTLREVLKHRTVEKVKMVEIDEMMVNASKEFLPDWSDCSDLIDSEKSCFDDIRTDLSCEDALAWFIDRYEYPCKCKEEGAMKESMREHCKCDDDEGDGTDSDDDEDVLPDKGEKLDIFDVIIMDALDPQDNIDFADALYDNTAFVGALYGALADDGILVLQLGDSPHKLSPPEQFSANKHRFRVMTAIENMGFQSMHIYEESHCGFHDPWSFLVACKSSTCRFNWYANEAEKDLQIHRRVGRTTSGVSPLKYFDGATMKNFQTPPKAWETVFCRQVPTPPSCSRFRGYDKNVINYGSENFEAKSSTIGDGAGRGTFAKVDIPKGAYLVQEQAPAKIHVSHGATRRMERLYENCVPEADDVGEVAHYMYGYGFQYNLVAQHEYYVDSGIMTFVNHGCNGTNNIGGEIKQPTSPDDPFSNEQTLDPTKVAVRGPVNFTAPFDPVVERHIPLLASSFDVALRDIMAGEELTMNYLYFIVDGEEWVEEVQNLQAQCRGEAVGSIKEDEVTYATPENKPEAK